MNDMSHSPDTQDEIAAQRAQRAETRRATVPATPVNLARRHRWLSRTRYLPWSTCLSRSLALGRYARAAGLDAELRLGGSLEQGRFGAHAWLRVGDEEFGRNGFEALEHDHVVSDSR